MKVRVVLVLYGKQKLWYAGEVPHEKNEPKLLADQWRLTNVTTASKQKLKFEREQTLTGAAYIGLMYDWSVLFFPPLQFFRTYLPPICTLLQAPINNHIFWKLPVIDPGCPLGQMYGQLILFFPPQNALHTNPLSATLLGVPIQMYKAGKTIHTKSLEKL